MDGPVLSIHDFWQGDACIVAVARLVSLWQDTCNYNSAHAAFLSHVRESFVSVIKQKLSLDNIVLGGLGTDETSVALSPFFEVAGYNFGQMRTQKWFRLTDPILVPSLYLATKTGSAGRTLNRPLQTARFIFQALLEFDGRVCGWAGFVYT